MQLELSLLLRDMNVTTILVTHDQREAFALADRVAIMEAGRIAQIGTPEEIYRAPTNSSVLRFLGTTNHIAARLSETPSGPQVHIRGCIVFHPPYGVAATMCPSPIWVDLRAEDIAISDEPTPIHATQPAVIVLRTFLGSQERFVLKLDDDQIVVDRPCQPHRKGARRSPGDQVYLNFDPLSCRFSPVP
jgi:ABC-type Fe3+/spermidine/putrescine transport system ATPase subunit